MSTRSVIAKPDGDGFIGRYHHFDGYPSGLGRTLVTALSEYFAGDLERMVTELIDEEHVGWSNIIGCDRASDERMLDFILAGPDDQRYRHMSSARVDYPDLALLESDPNYLVVVMVQCGRALNEIDDLRTENAHLKAGLDDLQRMVRDELGMQS